MTRQYVFARISCGILFVLIVALVSQTALAGADPLKGYSTDFTGVAVILDIDDDSGDGIVPPEYADCNSGQNPPNTVFSVNFTSGFAYVDNTLYGIEWEGGAGPDIFLYTLIDSFCAQGVRVESRKVRVGDKAVGLTNLESLAYCDDNSTLYSVDFDFGAHTGRLATIDQQTGAGAVVGKTMSFDVRIVGLTCSTTGQLYGISSGFGGEAPAFYRIDRSTGADTRVGPLNLAPNTLESLHVYGNGQFLGAGTQLFNIDDTTGAAAPVASKGTFPTVWALSSKSKGDPDGGGDFVINAGMSGSWFDPSHNGEGWLLEILFEETKLANGMKTPGVAVAYWFSYLPPDAKSFAFNQAWMVGVGSVQGDTITFSEVNITSGGAFGPDFDPADVIRTIWGTWIFSFFGCGTGTMSYDSGIPGYGSGTLALARITSVAGLDCDALASGKTVPAESQKVTEIDGSMSGSWFDPDHDGEGWLIEILPGGIAVIYWFSYTPDGTQQSWFVGTGTIDGKTITVDGALLPSGSEFGPGFDPDAVSLFDWGTMSFTFDTCNTGTMTYSSIAGFGSGSLNMQRITSLAGLSCP